MDSEKYIIHGQGGHRHLAGSDHTAGIDAILCTVDLLKRDSEIKILLDCTEEEKMLIYKAHNDTSCMKAS